MSSGTAHEEGVVTLTASDFRKISDLAFQKFGLNLKSGKEGLVAARLGKKIRQGGFASFADYHRHVLADATGDALIELIDSLTTNHTCFLRESGHFDFLGEAASGDFRDYPELRIWSAACSSGEEPYSIAMYLSDVAEKTECRWKGRLHITATDISTRMLAKAQRGVYETERFRDIPRHWWQRYLLKGRETCGGLYKIKPEVAKMVEFGRVNLVEPLPRRTFHLIFCRNVMMYFDRPTQQDIVDRLADCVEPGGYLLVGHSETLTGIHHKLRYIRPAVYRQEAGLGGAGRRP